MADRTKGYRHTGEQMTARPEIGAAPRFKGKKEARVYRYDSSLAPALEWDTNPTREVGAFLIRCIEEAARLSPPHTFPEPRVLSGADGSPLLEVGGLTDALERLKRIERPFLDWAGKAERPAVEVPTLPLFVHERLSTDAIVQTLEGHKRQTDQSDMFTLFSDPHRPLSEQVRAFEHKDQWVNRMILGDSLVVTNSLLGYEGMGGQVQMIYMDPPYGVKFGSNFQPFVRKPGVGTDDADMTREPEMVQAYRDTWELGLHSYLTYLRDRLTIARDLLTPSGSIFVQISDENLHHVREVMDEVFGSENFISQISFQTTSGFETKTIATLGDFLLWYARDHERVKVRKLYRRQMEVLGEGNARWVLLSDGSYRGVTAAEKRGEVSLPKDAKFYNPGDLQSQGAASKPQPFAHKGKTYSPGANSHWKAEYPTGMDRLAKAGRIHVAKSSIRYRRFSTDFAFQEIGSIWTDTITGNFTDDKLFVVQTNTKVVERCLLLTTDPGDLVLDPTCGSGTTAYMSEALGRRWITIDTSRVPLALARQRILTATFPWYSLRDQKLGPASGFVYSRRQNRKGDEIGGIVPHIKLENIANDEPPDEKIIVDEPDTDDGVTRITGPFVVEGTLPTPLDLNTSDVDAAPVEDRFDQVARMIEVLRRSPVLNLSAIAR